MHFTPGPDLTAAAQVDRFAALFAAVRAGAGPDADVAVDIHNSHPRIALQLTLRWSPTARVSLEDWRPHL